MAFPSSMVDRMVPATTAGDRELLRRDGLADAWPVATEPFTQWVLEDTFPTGRPPWERAGVELVSDVAVHEQAKLRILNAAHSAFAYWGLLAGHRWVAEAVADPVLLDATRHLLSREVLPMLDAPPGWDLTAYVEQVLERFGNRTLGYTTAKIAGDGSQKLPVRLVPTVSAPGRRTARRAVRAGPRCLGRLHGRPTVGFLRHRGRGPCSADLVAARDRLDLSGGCDCRLAGPAGVSRGPFACRARVSAAKFSSRPGGAGEVTSEPCSEVHAAPRLQRTKRLTREPGEQNKHAPRHLAARPRRRHRVGDAGAAPRRRAGAGGAPVRRGDAAHARRAGRRALLRRAHQSADRRRQRANGGASRPGGGRRCQLHREPWPQRRRARPVPRSRRAGPARRRHRHRGHARTRRRPRCSEALSGWGPRRSGRRPEPGCPLPGHALRADRWHRRIRPGGLPPDPRRPRRRRELDGRPRAAPGGPIRRDRPADREAVAVAAELQSR